MNYQVQLNQIHSPNTDLNAFQVDRLWCGRRGRKADITSQIDCTYEYASLKELRWHLAERFGYAPESIKINEA